MLVNGSTVYLLAVGNDGELKVYPWFAPANSLPAATAVVAVGADSSPAAVVSGGGLNILYTSDRTFYEAWSAVDGIASEAVQTTFDGAPIRTSAPASMVYFDKSICAAYKAEKGKDIYLLSGGDYELHPGGAFHPEW
jgi:hypothetical protein